MNDAYQDHFNALFKYYHSGQIQKCSQIVEETQRTQGLYANDTLWNGQFCISSMGTQIMMNLKTKKDHVEPKSQHWFSTNPFLIYDPSTSCFLSGVRILNYVAKLENRPNVVQGQVRTFYEGFVLDAQMNFLRQFPLPDMPGKLVERNWVATGTEDYRVIPHPTEDYYVGFCTGIETHEEGPVRMCSFRMDLQRDHVDGVKTITGVRFSQLTPLRGMGDEHQQKNWIPLFLGDQLHAVYSHTPLILLKVESSGQCVSVLDHPTPIDRCKGGTPWIPFEYQGQEGYLTLVHSSADHNFRVYYHRFLWYNKEFQLRAYTRLFYFHRHHTIEFAVGMWKLGSRIYISLGYEDRQAIIDALPAATVRGELEDRAEYDRV